MYRLHLTFDQLPKSLNKALRSNRWRNNEQHKHWHNLVLCKLLVLPKHSEPLKQAKLRIVRHSHRTLDYDGCVGSMKPVIDALVTNGVLIDDSWNVTGAWDVDQVFRPKKDGPLLELFVTNAKE